MSQAVIFRNRLVKIHAGELIFSRRGAFDDFEYDTTDEAKDAAQGLNPGFFPTGLEVDGDRLLISGNSLGHGREGLYAMYGDIGDPDARVEIVAQKELPAD